MKKILGLFVSVFVISCGATKSVDKSTGLYEVLTQQSDGGGNIRFFEILSEPNEIMMLKSDESLKGKINQDDINDIAFLMLQDVDDRLAEKGYSFLILYNIKKTFTIH